MTKFGGVISKARAAKQHKEEHSDQATGLQGNQNSGNKDNQNSHSQPVLSEQYDVKVTTEEGDIVPNEQLSELFVNLSIKVPKRLRQHWAAEAKRSGTTLTKVITDALQQKFGEP
jgi:SNF2 family DNA or RNA helicase